MRIVAVALGGVLAVSACGSPRAVVADAGAAGRGGSGGSASGAASGGGSGGGAGALSTGSAGTGGASGGASGGAGVEAGADVPDAATGDGAGSDVAPETGVSDGGDTAPERDGAVISGDVFGEGFDTTGSGKAILDGATSGTANLVYPLDHALFPPNLSPVYAQIQTTGATMARLAFRGTGVDLNFYGFCAAGMPGAGCSVKMPLSLTRQFVSASELGDIQLTARVSSGGAPAETQTINVAWAGLDLAGGLYYWSPIIGPPGKTDTSNLPTPPNYILLDPGQANGSSVLRYAFSTDGRDPLPALVWTDDGGPASTPPFDGAPGAWAGGTAGNHCIGCHAISGNGKYMALTLGGSSPASGANFALLDIGLQALVSISPTASIDPNSSPTSNPTDYWKKFRVEGLATESTWGPTGDRLVSMSQSKLYLTQVTANGTTGTATRSGPIVPTWQAQEAYAADPFWSPDGTLFVFTSFAQPSVGLYNESGLNGDEKKGGQIVVATADATGVHDDARILIARVAGATNDLPSTSDDSKLVVFDQSTCGTDPDVNKYTTDYGNGTCDGYDDSSAKIWIASPTGGTPTLLGRANGVGTYGNAWPRFGPSHGTFRGQTLYWLTFSSRRPYGVQVNSGVSALAAHPQLWLAGVMAGSALLSDPSFAPVWLPGQNANPSSPTGNHTPQWVATAVPLP